MKLNKLLLFTTILLLLTPAVLAVEFDEILGQVGEIMFSFFESDWVVFAFTLIFLVVLLYGVFMAGLSRIPSIAQGKNTKTIAVALAFLCSLGIVWPLAQIGLRAALERILGPIGFFGGVALAFVVFAFFWYSMKDSNGGHNWPMAFIAAGLALIFWGQFTDDTNAIAWGWVFLIIGLLGMLVGAFGGKWGSGGSGGSGGGGSGGDGGGDGKGGKGGKKGELDNDNPGKVTVYIYNADNTPLKNVRVTVGPDKGHKWFGHVGPKKRGIAEGWTDADGKVGPFTIGSGAIKIDADASHLETKGRGFFKAIWRGMKNIGKTYDRDLWRASRSEVLAPGEDKVVKMNINRNEKAGEGYEAFIEDARFIYKVPRSALRINDQFEDTNTETKHLRIKGEVR